MVSLTFSTLCWQNQLRLHLQYLKWITNESVFHFQRATLLLRQSYSVKYFPSASPPFLQTSAGYAVSCIFGSRLYDLKLFTKSLSQALRSQYKAFP